MKVLLCSVGLSPQIVTEALYALRQQGWYPQRLLILTTAAGAAACNALLLPPGGGLDRYRTQFGAYINPPEIIIVPSDSGDMDATRALSKFADCANRVVGDICANPDSQLFLLLSGGRKTAAAYLALIMAMHGRTQDRLLHVLTRPDMVAVPGFWFPEPINLPLPLGQALNAAEVEVQLIDVPFPRLSAAARNARTFAELVRQFSTLPRPRLRIDQHIYWDDQPVRLPPALAGFLRWLAFLAPEGVPRVGASRSDYLLHYRQIAGISSANRANKRLSDPLEPEWVEEKATRLAKLGKALRMTPNGGSLVRRCGPPGYASYHLSLDPDDIQICKGTCS